MSGRDMLMEIVEARKKSVFEAKMHVHVDLLHKKIKDFEAKHGKAMSILKKLEQVCYFN